MINIKIKNFINLLTCMFMAVIFSLPVFAYEDCIITTNGKLTDIKIQQNDIVDIFPIVTISNDKNILIVHPLKEGESKFTVLKNHKEKYLFSVKVGKDKTIINDVNGFDIMTIDCPPFEKGFEYYFDLDEPPKIDDKVNESEKYKEYIDNIDAPPVLRGVDL